MDAQIKTILLVLHIVFGSGAVLLGLFALLARKPVYSKPIRHWHENSGRIFMLCMCVVLGSALLLTIMSLNPYFAGLTAASTIAVFSGYRILGRKRPDLNIADRAKILDWLLTGAVLAIGLLLISMGHSGKLQGNLAVIMALGYGSATYACYDLYRFAFPLSFPFTPQLWLYEHLVKMIGGYFGAVAAFSGSVLLFLDPPWRQLWATTLGQGLSIVLVLYYHIKFRTRQNMKKKHAEAHYLQ